MAIRFGTDGWRAVISEDFTFENVRYVAQAIADLVLDETNGTDSTFVVGYDTRFLSDRYAATVATVLAGNGIRVKLCERFAATPAISYATVGENASGGVMITASHNPPRYNGIKLKADYGGAASPLAGRRIEQLLHRNFTEGLQPNIMPIDAAIRQGMIEWFDPYPAYAAHIRTLIDFESIVNANLNVAVDAMYGAGIGYTDRLLREHGIDPVMLHHDMNPGFGGLHPEPIGRHLQALMTTVKSNGIALGLATDGDADRIGAVGPSGAFIDPHCIMTLALDYLLQLGERGAVVKTVSTTQMLNVLAEQHGLVVYETPVGFNHISDIMLSQDVLIGGEESGGISIKGHIPEGDGILMALLLTELVSKQEKDIEALIGGIMDNIGHFSYARHDFTVRPFSKADLVQQLSDNAPQQLAGQRVIGLNTKDGVKYLMEDNSWLLVRPSGTEPVLRVYAEASSDERVRAILGEGARLAETIQPQSV